MLCSVSLSRSSRLLLCVALGSLTSCGGGGSTGGGGSSSPPLVADFAISASPNSGTITPGGALLTQITVRAINGFAGSVNVNIATLPSGVTVSPSSSFKMSAGSAQDLVVSVSSSAAQGSVAFDVQGSTGSLQHSARVSLQIQTQTLSGFSIRPIKPLVSFSQGGSGSTGIDLESTR